MSIEECLISSLRIQPFCPQHRASKKCRRGVDSSYGRSASELPTYVIVLRPAPCGQEVRWRVDRIDA